MHSPERLGEDMKFTKAEWQSNSDSTSPSERTVRSLDTKLSKTVGQINRLTSNRATDILRDLGVAVPDSLAAKREAVQCEFFGN
jgi:hypothetical protein